MTPMDEFRSLLGVYAEGDASFQARLNQLMQQLRQQVLPELGARLLSPTASPGLKRAIYGTTVRFSWPEWVPHLVKALLLEPDLGVFDEGCAALGRLELRSAREALLRLAAQRADPDRQLILRRELAALESQQPIAFYLSRLLEGDGNPRLAHQGARGLAALAEAEDLPALLEALPGADPLASRLLLRAIAELPGGEPGRALLDLFQETLRILRDYEELEALGDRLAAQPRTAARTDLVATLDARLAPRGAEALEDLKQALAAGEAAHPLRPMERLRPLAEGPFETFAAEALTTLLEGKIARFSAMVTEAQENARRGRERSTGLLDQICEGVAHQALTGHLPWDQAFQALARAFPEAPHTDGLDLAFCRLVQPGDGALEWILKVPDLRRRGACLDAIGAREEDAFMPFFLQAMQDPIVEVGQRAIHHLGKLPSSVPTVLQLLDSGHLDQVRTALRIFGENATPAAAEPLMAFIRADARDDLILEAVEALGAIRHPGAAPLLLEMLHDGKPARLQTALVQALAKLATPEAGLGLLHKAASLKLSLVLIVALEGALAPFPGFDHPFPEDQIPALEQLITRCCDDREGEGQRLRAILATQHLYCFDQALYARLKDQFSDFLFDLRTKSDWDRETNDRIAAILKELSRRSASLCHIASKEAKIRSLAQAIPPAGPARIEALLALRDSMQDPEFILRPELAGELTDLVLRELERKGQDWREQARLCEIAGLVRQESLVEPIRELYLQAQGLGLRSAAKGALAALGLDESDLNRRPQIRTILLLEPSAFFRKRLLAALDGRWQVREAGTHTEAGDLLEAQPVDLLLSEQMETGLDLRPWLQAQVERRRCRWVLLSTASRDPAPEGSESWLMGILHKPYPPEQLLKALEP
jgi:hypothetical protein